MMHDGMRKFHTCVSPTKTPVYNPVSLQYIVYLFSYSTCSGPFYKNILQFSYLCTIVYYSDLDIDTLFLVAHDSQPNIQLQYLNT